MIELDFYTVARIYVYGKNMRYTQILLIYSVLLSFCVGAQEAQQEIYKIPQALLAGEGLDKIAQQDSSRTVYQKRVYDGSDFAVYIVAIETDITNTFESFPFEEFIYWINGKAVVEPVGEPAFEVHSGDYFIQAKGYNGKWNFIDNGGLHLELALVAKNRPDSTFKSPMTKALVFDRNILSGVQKPADGQIYSGPELTVNLLESAAQIDELNKEKLLHVLSGVLVFTAADGVQQTYYPGDFFVVPADMSGAWYSDSLQGLRLIEVCRTGK